MTNYRFPTRPTKYWINELNYKCKKCGRTFQIHIPNSDDIVKFECQATSQIKWLPTNGDGGYLGLFKKLYSDYKGELYPKIVQEFITKLNNYIEKSSASDYFQQSDYKHECIYCKSKEIVLINEEILENPDLDWLKISCELIQ